MASVCFYFQVHQPRRLRHYTVFDRNDQYFDDYKNAFICRKVANKCYLPANRLLLELIRKYDGRFKVSYSITGVLLEQLPDPMGFLIYEIPEAERDPSCPKRLAVTIPSLMRHIEDEKTAEH